MAKQKKPKIQITSDGTLKGTQIKVNGKSITDTDKVLHAMFDADATEYPEESFPSTSVNFSYEVVEKDDNGVLKRVSYRLYGNDRVPNFLGMGKKYSESDSQSDAGEDRYLEKEPSFYVGSNMSEAGRAKDEIIRKILMIDASVDENILRARTIDSLKDKLDDISS